MLSIRTETPRGARGRAHFHQSGHFRGHYRRWLCIEPLEERRMLDATDWTNPDEALDVSNDGFVSPIDPLLVLNRINNIGPGPVPGPIPPATPDNPQVFYDVSGDGYFTGLDALLVIARLNNDRDPPDLSAKLVNDTGASNSDNFTADMTIAGSVTDQSRIKSFQVSFDGQAPVSLLSLLQSDGSYTMSPAQLAAKAGITVIDGTHSLHFSAMDILGHVSTRDLTVTVHRVDLSLAPFTDDLTPHVTVQVASALIAPNGTSVHIDVDLNNDGAYTGNELDYSIGTLWNSTATFELTKKLALSDPNSGGYNLHLRARVFDVTGTQEAVDTQSTLVDTNQSTALKDYVYNNDGAFHYDAQAAIITPGFGYTAYTLQMTSQRWLTSDDVSQSLWTHWVVVYVPTGFVLPTAILVIDGGSNTNTPPDIDLSLAASAVLLHTVVIDLKMVPNEPETFFGENPPVPRSEDAIIAYTMDHYLDDTSNPDWLVLLPMVKAAVKTMDMAQAVLPFVTGQPVNNFVVTGASKRGWTTWLTAAVDDRVVAMVPMVFDALNLDESMVHHYGAYGFFAPAIAPYEQLNVFDRMLTPEGQDMNEIVDPYHYISAGRYQIPKLLINSPGDEFFVPDSAQFYWNDLPGPKYLRYIPNTSHSLNTDATSSVVTFFASLATGTALPDYSWTVRADGALIVTSATTPTVVKLWQATNPNARDFRILNTGVTYAPTILTKQADGTYIGNVPIPATGATAYFVELTYPSLIQGQPIVFTTEVRVKTNIPLVPWPFQIGGPLLQSTTDPAPLQADLLFTNTGGTSDISARGTFLSLATTAGGTGNASAPIDASGLAAVITTSPPKATLEDDTQPTSGTATTAATDLAGADWGGSAVNSDAVFGSDANLEDVLDQLPELSTAEKLFLALV